MSTCRRRTRSATPASRASRHASSSYAGESSSVVALAAPRRRSSMPISPTPPPTSRTVAPATPSAARKSTIRPATASSPRRRNFLATWRAKPSPNIWSHPRGSQHPDTGQVSRRWGPTSPRLHADTGAASHSSLVPRLDTAPKAAVHHHVTRFEKDRRRTPSRRPPPPLHRSHLCPARGHLHALGSSLEPTTLVVAEEGHSCSLVHPSEAHGDGWPPWASASHWREAWHSPR